MDKKALQLTIASLVLLAVFVTTGAALATGPGSAQFCGASSPSTSGDANLLVKKDVYCEKSLSWVWKIFKSADQSSLTLPAGETAVVNYSVAASAQTAESLYSVNGTIVITNLTAGDLVVEQVSDSLASVTCPSAGFPLTLPAGGKFVCTYAGSLSEAAAVNQAVVDYKKDGVVMTAVGTAPIDWTMASATESDVCASVSDTFTGDLGTVCAGEQTSFTFTYDRTVGPFPVCGVYTVDNTASFVTSDTGSTGSSSWVVDVNVPCEGGCTLTPGYWKTHSAFGPAPYDATWALLGEGSPFFFSGKSYYDVLWTAPRGNPYYILAHAYIAAKLNQLNGADFSAAQPAFDAATALFSNPANTPTAVGKLKGDAKNQWIDLATTLDDYNNGLTGPGHCN